MSGKLNNSHQMLMILFVLFVSYWNLTWWLVTKTKMLSGSNLFWFASRCKLQTSQSTRTLTPPNQFNINSGGTMTFWPLGSLQQGVSLQVPVVHIIWWCHERKVIFYRLPRPINALPKRFKKMGTSSFGLIGYFTCLLKRKLPAYFLGNNAIETCYAVFI